MQMIPKSAQPFFDDKLILEIRILECAWRDYLANNSRRKKPSSRRGRWKLVSYCRS